MGTKWGTVIDLKNVTSPITQPGVDQGLLLAVLSLPESSPVVAQGQRHRAGRDTSIQIRRVEIFIGLAAPIPSGVAERASQRATIARPEKTYKRHQRRPASMPGFRAVRLARTRQTAE